MSIRGFANGVADAIEAVANTIHNSGIIQGTVRHGTRLVGKTAQFGGKTALKAANVGLAGVAESVDFIRRNQDTIKAGAKAFGKGTAQEAGTWGKAAVGAVDMLDRSPFVKAVDFTDSLVGRKFTGLGTAVVVGGALISNTGKATKDYIQNRAGQNDGVVRRPAPTMTNPYDLSSQMAYSSIGQSFANNAGADGDLALALSKMR
jgi:hypothetical protein